MFNIEQKKTNKQTNKQTKQKQKTKNKSYKQTKKKKDTHLEKVMGNCTKSFLNRK